MRPGTLGRVGELLKGGWGKRNGCFPLRSAGEDSAGCDGNNDHGVLRGSARGDLFAAALNLLAGTQACPRKFRKRAVALKSTKEKRFSIYWAIVV